MFKWKKEPGLNNNYLDLFSEISKIDLPELLNEQVFIVDLDRLLFWDNTVDKYNFIISPILIETFVLYVWIIAHAYIKLPGENLFWGLNDAANLLNVIMEVLDPVSHFLASRDSLRIRTLFWHYPYKINYLMKKL